MVIQKGQRALFRPFSGFLQLFLELGEDRVALQQAGLYRPPGPGNFSFAAAKRL